VVRAEQLLREAEALSDPTSPAGMDFQAYLEDMEEHDPALAHAIAVKVAARTQFLMEKAGPEPVNALGMKTRRDPLTQAKLNRYARAIVDPQGAIARIAAGEDSAEDRETVEALNPAMWGEFVEKTVAQMEEQNLPHAAKIRASLALGIPLDDSMSPDRLAFTQSRMPAAAEVKAKANGSVDMGAQTAQLTGDRIATRR
jgi:hypothetical protein